MLTSSRCVFPSQRSVGHGFSLVSTNQPPGWQDTLGYTSGRIQRLAATQNTLLWYTIIGLGAFRRPRGLVDTRIVE